VPGSIEPPGKLPGKHLAPIIGKGAETTLNKADQVIKLVRQRTKTRIQNPAERNAPGIDAAKHCLMPIRGIRTAVNERRLKAAIIASDMADQEHLAALKLNVDTQVDILPAATAARKINNRKTGTNK